MVNNLCKSLGAKLPHPKYFNPDSVHTIESLDSQNHSPIASTSKLQPDYIYSFPLPSDLISEETEEFLRELGFGYRSRYVYETSLLLLEKAKEKELHYDDWLHTLTKLELDDAREILLQFLGVGRKVADCVLLFGLQHRDVVPVDTHV